MKLVGGWREKKEGERGEGGGEEGGGGGEGEGGGGGEGGEGVVGVGISLGRGGRLIKGEIKCHLRIKYEKETLFCEMEWF